MSLEGEVRTCEVWYYSPDLRRKAPSWVWAVVAVCTFVYQTLDNMDGKQARFGY